MGKKDREELEDSEDNGRDNSPVWIWIIAIYFILIGALSIFRTFLPVTGIVESDPPLDSRDYVFATVFWLIWSLYVAAGVTLLMRKAVSHTLFRAIIAATAAAIAGFTIATGSLPLGFDELGLVAPEWIIIIAATIYTWKLRQDGTIT